MGLFKKTPNTQKTYTVKEAKNVIFKYPNYTAIPIGIDEMQIIREADVRAHIDQYKEEKFKERINGNGNYKSLGNTKHIKYNSNYRRNKEEEYEIS